MTNPTSQTVAKETWTKVATAVSKGKIRFLDSNCEYYHTYRDTGSVAPNIPALDPTDGTNAFNEQVTRLTRGGVSNYASISPVVSSDIYIYCAKAAGRIIVEV